MVDNAELEAEILWAVACPTPDADAVRSLVDARIDGGADLGAVVSTACRQRLGPLLWRALVAANREERLGPWAEELATESLMRRQEALLLHPHALARAVQPLKSVGLQPVVFKGPAIAVRYPAPGLRPMVDVDLLLPQRDRGKAVAALSVAGWRPVARPGRRHYDTVMTHPDVPSLVLEVHHGLDVWYERSNRLRIDALWECRVPFECMGVEAFGLPAEEELVALAAHAGKPFHCFSELIWATDVAVAGLTNAAAIDWHRVERLSSAWRCRTVLAVALSQAARLGLDVPPDLLDTRASRIRRGALAPLFDVRWPVVDLTDSLRTRLRYALVDDWVRRATLFVVAPAPAPVWRWPGRLAGTGWRATGRAWRLARTSPQRVEPRARRR